MTYNEYMQWFKEEVQQHHYLLYHLEGMREVHGVPFDELYEQGFRFLIGKESMGAPIYFTETLMNVMKPVWLMNQSTGEQILVTYDFCIQSSTNDLRELYRDMHFAKYKLISAEISGDELDCLIYQNMIRLLKNKIRKYKKRHKKSGSATCAGCIATAYN